MQTLRALKQGKCKTLNGIYFSFVLAQQAVRINDITTLVHSQSSYTLYWVISSKLHPFTNSFSEVKNFHYHAK